ncbi:MAG: tetratricopeptide repeat protein [Planctomycetota bacterium]|nr:tetratricopeptide repeat protein [Planctomycetota bacterium]
MSPRMVQLNRLLERDPRDAFVLYGLGQEHAKAGNHAEAIAMFDRALEADAGTFYAYFFKARCLSALGRREEAVAVAEAGQAAAARAGDAKATSELGSLVMELEHA